MVPKPLPAWATRFREVLDGKGLGTKRLATLIRDLNDGVTPNGGSAENLRAYKQGRVRNPRPAVIRLVSKALGVRAEWLLDGELPMTAGEGRISELAKQYGEGLQGAEMEITLLRFLGGKISTVAPAYWDDEAVTPAYFLTWRRLVQLRSSALTDEEINLIGAKLRKHLIEFIEIALELNGAQPRTAWWRTDVALAWLSAVAVTAAWDRMEEG